MDLTVANNNNNNNNNTLLREYRKGNWNLQETMVLIEAKRMDDDRRMRRLGETSTDRGGKPAELRWKWVEDYCWKHGCLRSQNQCNDKWDNLMRDFKKVREYEKRILGDSENNTNTIIKSYWRIEKTQRKDNNLPSNLLPQIYEALFDVVERRGHRSTPPTAAADVITLLPPPPPPAVPQYPFLPSPVQPHYSNMAPAAAAAPPPPLHTVDSDTSEYTGSPAKRRKRGGGEGSSGGGGAAAEEIGTAITKSAATIAEAIESCEERGERRHRELMSVHERRLRIEETKAENNRQGVDGLVDAINKLANSIFALAAHNKNQPSSSK